ncbi:Alpha/Beta hydrolase protein [Xylogone sp. PMI_703]|nr:Alpha/Beta hydrolase protein [Xylogone sp. PMI_703]
MVDTLHFVSVNDAALETVVLIHGAFCSHHEWDIIAQHLSQYHLLIPDLPGHGRGSSANLHFTIPDAAALVADLIEKYAHGGRASLVGMSLGGYVALYVAAKYPALVQSAFVSGCHQYFTGLLKSILLTVGLTVVTLIVSLMPKSWTFWMLRKQGMQLSEEFYTDLSRNLRLNEKIRIAKAISTQFTEDIWEKVTTRTCLVVGGNETGSWIVGERAKLLQHGNPESRGVRIEGLEHAWDMQDPELFADGILKWIEGKEMQKRFVVVR